VIILPYHTPGVGLDRRLSAAITPEQIDAALGLGTSTPCDGGKTDLEWSFTADGYPCGIWDYKGRRWSTYGPRWVFVALFGEAMVEQDRLGLTRTYTPVTLTPAITAAPTQAAG
jgi:hypothetical protein